MNLFSGEVNIEGLDGKFYRGLISRKVSWKYVQSRPNKCSKVSENTKVQLEGQSSGFLFVNVS